VGQKNVESRTKRATGRLRPGSRVLPDPPVYTISTHPLHLYDNSTITTVTRKRVRGADAAATSKRIRGSIMKQAMSANRAYAVAGMTSGYTKGLQRAYAKEKGYVDLAVATYALDTTGSVTLLNTIAQGAAVTQRVGKKVILKGLQARGFMNNNSAAASNDVAYMIVYDKRPTGSLPTITDILVSASPQSMNNDNNAGRFRILKRCDEILVGNTSFTGIVANALTEATVKSADWWLDLKSAPTTYKAAATGGIGDIEEGALYLVTIGGTAAGTSAAALTLAFRVRFLDV